MLGLNRRLQARPSFLDLIAKKDIDRLSTRTPSPVTDPQRPHTLSLPSSPATPPPGASSPTPEHEDDSETDVDSMPPVG